MRISDRVVVQLVEGEFRADNRVVIVDETTTEEIVIPYGLAYGRLQQAVSYFGPAMLGGYPPDTYEPKHRAPSLDDF